MKRNKILAISYGLALLALIGSQTLANDTASFTATNVITTGNVEMSITETTVVEMTATEAKDYENITNNEDGTYEVAYDEFFANNTAEILPGDTVSKIVTVANDGTEAFYTRILVEVSGMEKEDVAGLVFDMDTDDWEVGTDGFVKDESGVWSCYYYYMEAVDAEEEVTFFETVKFPTTMDDAYLLADADSITISVTGEAVQESHTIQEHLGTYLGWEVVTMAPEKIADNVDGGDS